MEHAQDAGALPSSASDLKPVVPLFTDPLANDNNTDTTFFEDFGRFDIDHLDYTLNNLDDLKVSTSPPPSQAAMHQNPVSASAFALEETIMDPRFQQAMQHEVVNPFPSLTHAPMMNVSQSQELPPYSASHYMSLVTAHEFMPAPMPAALTSPGKTQELPMPNSTLPLYTSNTSGLAYNSQVLVSEPVSQASTSFAPLILGAANMSSPIMLPPSSHLVLPTSLSQPVAVLTREGRGRRSAATQPSASMKTSKRAHPEPPASAFDDVSDSDDEDEDESEEKFDASASTPAVRRARHTSSASHSTALLHPEEDYKQRRSKNNEAVRKSRAKAKQKSQQQAEQLEVVQAENKRLKTDLDHVKVERDLLRTILQQVMTVGGQPATETAAASNPALREAVNALIGNIGSLSPDRSQPHAGTSSPRIHLPPASLAAAGLRSPSIVARPHAHARSANGPR